MGTVISGGVAGFPIPPLRYWVGDPGDVADATTGFYLDLPVREAELDPMENLEFRWQPHADAAFYRLEVTSPAGIQALSAILSVPIVTYTAPSWLPERTGARGIRWRVVALGAQGQTIDETPWRVGVWR